MKVMVLEGNGFERGLAYGTEFRALIAGRCDGWKEPLQNFAGFTRAELEQLAGNVLFYSLDHAPEFIDEIRGVAQAVGRNFSEVFFAMAGSCLSLAGPPQTREESCSNWAADTIDRGPMLGKTEDMEYYPEISLEKVFTVQKVRPAMGLKYIVASRPGTLWGSAGINEAGLAVGQSSGPWGVGQDGHGVVYPYPTKHMLQFCQTADQALAYLEVTPIVGKGYIFMIADAASRFYCVEKWGSRTGVRTPERGALYCANLFVHPAMQFLPPRFDHQHSLARLQNLQKLYAEQARAGKYTEEFMKGVLIYHADAGSICRHGTDTLADAKGYSFGFLFYCRDRMMMLAEDLACQSRFLHFTFDF